MSQPNSQIIATSEGSKTFEPVPAGVHFARCIRMYHIGTITDQYMGQPKIMNKVMLTFELPNVKKIFEEAKGEQPQVIGKEFTLSMANSASLRGFMESWRGKNYTEDEAKAVDVTRVIGQPCFINIVHKDRAGKSTIAEIKTISPLAAGMVCPPQVNPSFIFGYNPFDINKFWECPAWIQKKIVTSKEFVAMFPQGAPVNPNAVAPVNPNAVAPVNTPVAPAQQQFAPVQPVQPVAQVWPQAQTVTPVNPMATVVESDPLPF